MANQKIRIRLRAYDDEIIDSSAEKIVEAVKNVSNEKDIQSNRGMCYCYTNIKSLPLELCVRCSR